MRAKNGPLGSINAPAFGEKKEADNVDLDLELGSEEGFVYEVPKSIRQGNEKAYTPQLISIGPLHYRKRNLAKMAMYKVDYQKKFCERTSEETLKRFWRFIELKEKVILNCYEALIIEDEFVLMIFYDALFIVELFFRYYEKKTTKNLGIRDFLLNETWSAGLRRDLILLENQIPFFVVEELYNLYFNFTCQDKLDSASALPLLYLACFYFSIPWDETFKKMEILHLTDLKRCYLVKKNPSVPSRIRPLKTVHSATNLNNAGVELAPVRDKNVCLLDIQLEGKKLIIPKLTVGSNTEAYIRNVMAFEMCHNPDEAYVCAYIELMYYLIKTDKDVDLLTEKGVLSIEGKKEGRVVSKINLSKTMVGMIKKLMQGVGKPPACYRETGRQLNHHYENSRRNKIAIIFKENLANLKRVYFPNLLRGTISSVAFAVVVLTFIQTVLAFLK